ncbi:MAG TPA: hypothetical protein PK306_26850 [Aquabacterium sp.]|nr:hypothetical protein [Aquabacterium sp.]HQC99330.1 hypothetical protein [Aquabacterium sp.]
MKISSTALKAKQSCASGYRWFARRFKSPAEYQSVIDALVDDGRVDCVFRPIVTDRSGIVTGDFGIVTGRSGIVTAEVWRV